jgi:hypothetical protein
LQENKLGDFIDCRNEVDVASILKATTVLLQDKSRSEEISLRARARVDGKGAQRVALEIFSAVS